MDISFYAEDDRGKEVRTVEIAVLALKKN